ncbi:RNA polymerase sigma-70 factor (ECF subfamily) [Lacibacter cauensis]|uniref:RNA polymerase sigma-70 factor (ECF subfamily) n=1 Tax=Lacibacter cauensis TaxID=510947 RepID=A0A562SUK5_9BACT|nr:RNA polymerase sigma factor [Lacibacter cauensis]TWI84942.1 RNA polymerase sigma-70 factor (ECF subfamily) [Lacibacter cauensis]
MQNGWDTELIERCRNGDANAFKQLVESYQGMVYVFAFRMLCQEEDAKDVVQEAFIKVWRNLSKYNTALKFTTWLYKITANCCYDQLRKGKYRKQQVEIDQVKHVCEQMLQSNMEQKIMNKDLAAVISQLTHQLTPKQKLVFTLKELEGFEVNEISIITDLSPEKIKSNLYLARKTIREQLEKM